MDNGFVVSTKSVYKQANKSHIDAAWHLTGNEADLGQLQASVAQ